MRILLVRPVSPNERFCLGPFFRVEPLGLEYVAAALLRAGHQVEIVDLRFSRPLPEVLRRLRPSLVGISCSHVVDFPACLQAAREVKAADRRAFVLVGGHAAAVYPAPLFDASVDAVCREDGEAAVPALARALADGRAGGDVPGFWVRRGDGEAAGVASFVATPAASARVSLDDVALPARELVAPFRRRYLCVNKSPLYAVETARGCPFRCRFCSIWRFNQRAYRVRGLDAVCRDLASVGGNVFIVDDLFWYPRRRSLELARALRRRGIRKDWILVQSRLDTVARSPELLEAWRPVARDIDIFFGFEAPRDEQLRSLAKDMTVAAAEEGVRVARAFDYGVTGNFVVDLDWDEADFEAMWRMVDRLRLRRVGYTMLTPLPGTPLFDELAPRIRERDFSRWDMHHILFEPRLGRRRFFELFVASWRRNVLSPTYSRQKWWRWLRALSLEQVVLLARVLYRTQRLLRVDAYLAEAFPLHVPAAAADTSAAERKSCAHPRSHQ